MRGISPCHIAYLKVISRKIIYFLIVLFSDETIYTIQYGINEVKISNLTSIALGQQNILILGLKEQKKKESQICTYGSNSIYKNK